MDNNDLVKLRVEELYREFQEFKMISSPNWVQQSLQQIIEVQGELDTQLKSLRIYVDAKIIEMTTIKESTIEEVSDEELVDLWKKSGVTLKEIALNFSIQDQTASLWVNGKTKDALKRDQLKKFLAGRIK